MTLLYFVQLEKLQQVEGQITVETLIYLAQLETMVGALVVTRPPTPIKSM